MVTPYWEKSFTYGWELTTPIIVNYINGPVQVGTELVGVWVNNAIVCYDDGRPHTKRFRTTEEAKAYALTTYLLEKK